MSMRNVAPVAVNVRSLALTIVAGGAAMAVLWWAREVFIPVVLSVLISYALEPIVATLMRLRIGRIAASAIVVASLVAVLGYIAWTLRDDATAMLAKLPEAAERLRLSIREDGNGPGALDRVQKAAEELQKTADEAAPASPSRRGVQRVQVEEPVLDVRQYLYWGSKSALGFAGQAVLVIFFVFFLLATGDLFKRKLVKLAGPTLEKRRITVQILNEINAQIERFLLVRLAMSVVVGAATWIAFRLIGLEQAGLLAVMAAVFNTIPYLGPFIVAAVTAIVAFLQFGTIGMAAYASGISVVITSVEGWLLTPWWMSRAAQTNEVAVFVGLIFWSFVWGIWGTLLAVPMLVVAKAVCDRIDDLKPVGELLGQ